MSDRINVSIILVSYNTCNLTIETIKSIYARTRDISYEIILVDNNSTDDTVLKVRSLFPSVLCIENKDNKGFGAANNIGASIARGNYLFLLNTDTVLLVNAVKILSDYLDCPENSDVVAVGGNLYDINGNPTSSYSRLFPGVCCEINGLLFNLFHQFKFFNYFFNYTSSPIKFRGSISGADSMIRKEWFDKVKGFDEDFFLYYEETDLFYRLVRNGFFVSSIPEAKIIHLEGGSESVREITLERSFKSKFIYLSKHSTKIKANIIHRLYQLTCTVRILIFCFVKKEAKKSYWSILKRIENEVYLTMRNKNGKRKN
ncbi:glycosyltransferase family 2 protein [Dickeya sp. CFBP 2040]|uniref:Glycosyltransferase family 2 protein n=1 Tax=Dickeya poaceiphila TaxID=568768 RepID=A0A5B8HQB5_9GAMM|nr:MULTISPECIES: glycosyltransferase family 2 protein [Dickeya]NKI76221.1 glycosyltransferase family 2 protein [Dickeya sp. CFBP 2040]QDX31265.1 glycosyltransferase family 2 protein [Dickeya poaceiphila]